MNNDWCIPTSRKHFNKPIFSILITVNTLIPFRVIQNPYKPMGTVLVNLLALGEPLTRGNKLVTMRSMWGQKAIVRKEVVFSATFLFSYGGVNGWTKGGSKKATAI